MSGARHAAGEISTGDVGVGAGAGGALAAGVVCALADAGQTHAITVRVTRHFPRSELTTRAVFDLCHQQSDPHAIIG